MFDLENAVLQGWARDVDTNDWHVEARNLEVKLDDHGGVREFRILDNENVGVVVADSDGYLSIAGNAEVHGGHILIRGESLTNTEFITIQDQVDEISVHVFDVNPDGGISGEKGSFGTNYNDGYLYVNTDGATKWERLAMTSQIPNIENIATTLQESYDNDDHQGQNDGASIVTNPGIGSVIIGGSERLWVRTAGGLDLDGSFDMDGYAGDTFTVDLTGGGFSLDSDTASNVSVTTGNLTLETVTSGNVLVNIPDGTGDFIVDDAGGARYIRAISSNGELQLGDADTFVTVMDNLEVIGDLQVQGTTTYINTQELFVEDRLVRINTGSPSNFSGNVGLEAEVGSDGYVEFHWDDTQGRWEISIDRDTVPENQTFRPLPYLADAPATLDLSSTGVFDAHNYLSGAAVINTNADNFPRTFGPAMVNDSVQAALEAIDGYFWDLGDSIINLEEIVADTSEPNGFVNRTDSTFSFVNGTRTFTIQPNAPTTKYDIYIAGEKYTVDTTESVQITDTEGLWYIYFDGNRDLVASQTFDTRIITEWAYAAVIYWNADDNQQELLGDERHGITMDGATHSYLHNIFGAQWDSGLAITNLSVNGNGSTDADARFAVTDGVFRDEDLKFTITDDDVQDLDPIANIPIYWKESAAADWRVKPADTYPVIQAGSIAEATGTRISYNQNTGSTWQLTEVTNDGYMLMHYFATNDVDHPIIGICGENQYSTLGSASEGVIVEFNSIFLDGLPGPEFAPLATLIYHTSNSYANTPKAIVVKDEGGTEYTDWRLILIDRTGVSGISPTDHGSLAGLGDDDHLQYLTEARHDALPDDNPHSVTFTQAVTADAGTDITAAEAETLTDGSNADALHVHTSTSVSLDHDELGGLGDDDHLQYLRTDGTRMLSAEWNAGWVIQTAGIRYEGELVVDGYNGIVLDGSGSDVVPRDSCTDSLGDAQRGWTDLYICVNGTPISLIGDGDNDAPNDASGATIIGTNPNNFITTFGSLMGDSTVQAALEAIDGYLQDIVQGDIGTPTLQEVYEASCGDAEIITDASCGPVVISGTEQVVISTDSGLALTQEFTMTGDGPFVTDITGGINLSSEADINVTSTQNVNVNGEQGIVLDGYGNDVIPANSCTDSLGDSTHGWTDLFVCKGGTPISLIDDGEGGDEEHNGTAGANIVGTNPTNYATFGPDMFDSTVQSALEAIDGYFEEIFGLVEDNRDITLQEVYNNSCGDATIDLSEVCGPITFGGDGQVVFNNSDGITLTQEFTMTGDGPFVIDITGEINLSSEANINVTSTQVVNINGEQGIVLDGYEFDVTVQGNGQTIINSTGGLVVNNEFIMNGDGPFVVDITGEVNVSSESDINLTSTDNVNINGENGIVLDGYGNDVIPANSCTDDLGDSTHGWNDVWICKNGTPVAVKGAGGDSAPNVTSGAAVIGTNPLNFDTFGPDMFDNTVQAALEAVDGYLQDIISGDIEFDPFIQVKGLDINGCVLNGVVKVWTSAGTPGLLFGNNRTSRASWSLPVPADWDGVSDIVVEFVWAPSDASAGDVAWRMEYKSLTLTELASSAASNVDYTQAAGGTADGIQTTGVELAIPAAAISVDDELIVINSVRRGTAAADTYGGDVYLYLVKYSYTAQNIV